MLQACCTFVGVEVVAAGRDILKFNHCYHKAIIFQNFFCSTFSFFYFNLTLSHITFSTPFPLFLLIPKPYPSLVPPFPFLLSPVSFFYLLTLPFLLISTPPPIYISSFFSLIFLSFRLR